MERFSNFIDGPFAIPAARTMTTANPYTGEAWAEIAVDPAAVDVAVRCVRPWPVAHDARR